MNAALLRVLLPLALAVLWVPDTLAQPAIPEESSASHVIPFDSQDNTIVLTLKSPAAVPATYTVRVTEHPEWVAFESVEEEAEVAATTGEVLFTFDVAASAPPSVAGDVVIVISGESGEQWTKRISLSVGAPAQFVLEEAYPNPFQQQVTVPFTLPEAARVTVTAYDVLGRRVAIMADGEFGAGRHTAHLDATGLASGAYFIRAVMGPEAGTTPRVLTQRVTLSR